MDVNFSDVQKAAARWTQSVGMSGAAETQAVQKTGIDFEVNNVTFSKHQDGSVAPKLSAPDIPSPKVLLNSSNADLVQKTVTSIANDFHTDPADRERMAGVLTTLAQMSADGKPEAERAALDIWQVMSLISELTNKRQDTMAKVEAEFASAHEKQLEKRAEAVAKEGTDPKIAIASAFLSLGGGVSSSVAGAKFFDKKKSAALKIFADVSKQGANLVQLFEQENTKGKSVDAAESAKKLAIYKATMQGLVQLEQQAGGMTDKIRAFMKAANDADGRKISV